jgi:DNA-binding NarL/FixJ family response regulator
MIKPEMEKIYVSIIDDHSLFRNGLKLLLSAFPEIEVINECSNGKEFIQSLDKVSHEIVLMDIEMPVMNGIDATREAVIKKPDLKIITLSMFGEEEYYYKMIDAGVKGFILKNSDIDEVIKAIKAVKNGATYFSQEILYNVVKNISDVRKTEQLQLQLSQREIEILELICKGLSNQEIADSLCISKRTVDKHRANILGKTETKNTASLVMFAIEHKLVEP